LRLISSESVVATEASSLLESFDTLTSKGMTWKAVFLPYSWDKNQTKALEASGVERGCPNFDRHEQARLMAQIFFLSERTEKIIPNYQ
jgi:hypothetical protein